MLLVPEVGELLVLLLDRSLDPEIPAWPEVLGLLWSVELLAWLSVAPWVELEADPEALIPELPELVSEVVLRVEP